MPRLITAILARNEAGPGRFFARVLARCREFSDVVVVLDDGSTDETAWMAAEAGCVVRRRTGAVAWGNESPARKELWDFACEYATGPDDWVLVCDSDMLLQGDVRALCESEAVNCWAFILYDLWSETHYRSDHFWQGHIHPRPWLFAPNRVPAGWVPEWPERGLHCGHFPPNLPIFAGIAPSASISYLHFAYSTHELRIFKHAQYLSKRHLLSPFEIQHAESIIADP